MGPLPGETAISAKRAELAGKGGIWGLLSNKRTTLIGLFASLGGFVYGCKLIDNSGDDEAADQIRQPGNVRTGFNHEVLPECRM